MKYAGINQTSNDQADAATVNYEKLNILIEAFQFYPLIVKRDKNVSSSIYQILNSNKPHNHQNEVNNNQSHKLFTCRLLMYMILINKVSICIACLKWFG